MDDGISQHIETEYANNHMSLTQTSQTISLINHKSYSLD